MILNADLQNDMPLCQMAASFLSGKEKTSQNAGSCHPGGGGGT